MTKIEKSKIAFNLFGNAADSIQHVIELISYKTPEDEARRHKQIILFLAHGLELLLKQRLRMIHPSLVWENIDKAPNLDARTVGTESAIRRLTSIGGLVFHERDLRAIESLRKHRNSIEHHNWSATADEVDALAGECLGFILDFATRELDHQFFDYGSHRDSLYQDLVESNPGFSRSFEKRQTPHEDGSSWKCELCRGYFACRITGVCRSCGHNNHFEPEDSPF